MKAHVVAERCFPFLQHKTYVVVIKSGIGAREAEEWLSSVRISVAGKSKRTSDRNDFIN